MRFASLLLFAPLLACGGPEPSEATVESALRASWDFRIKKNRHRATRGGPKKLRVGRRSRRVGYRVRFESNVPYRTRDAGNQNDWNKLVGISTSRIHHNSIRLGWRWNPNRDRVELGFYGYLRGDRTFRKIAEVRTGQWIDVELVLDPNRLSVRAGSGYHEVVGDLGLNGLTSTWALVTAYFGGDEKAPHDMNITVRDLDVD